MMPCDYRSNAGQIVEFDLDLVADIAIGYSTARPTWTATLIYIPAKDTFVELRSSPQDHRGNSAEESEEVDLVYLNGAFGISPAQVAQIRSNPKSWRVINLRERA